MIRALIVDDERLARSELRRLLVAHPEIDIVGEAANISEAQHAIEQHQPDLIFLDVQMPGGSGFDLLAALDGAPEVIFTTAFDSYALKAFEVNALDYLQKPIEEKRLAAALERVGNEIGKCLTSPPQQLHERHKIFIKDGEHCWFVSLSKIVLFESEGNYTRVYFDGHRPLILRSLNQLEQRVADGRFFRVSRRHIVNMDFIDSIGQADTGGLTLTLQNGVSLQMSRRRAMAFKQRSCL